MMKNFFKKSLSVSLCAITLLASACTLPWQDDGPTGNNEVEFTKVVLADKGKTDYKIVIPDQATQYETFAASELQNLFEEATGAYMPIVKDSEIEYTSESKIISISDTTMEESLNLDLPFEKFGRTGVRAVTKDNALFLTGAEEAGSLFAVYDLLSMLFDYEYYELDVYKINKENRVLLPSLDWTNIPDFDERCFGDYLQYENSGIGSTYHAWRQRYEIVGSNTALGGHTNQVIINPTKYLAEHPDWFYPKGQTEPEQIKQLCLTNDEMRAEYTKNVINYLDSQPTTTKISLTQDDYNVWCDCTTCKAAMNKYGTNLGAVTQTLFINQVVTDVEEWLAEAYPGRQVDYWVYAYHQTVTAPAHKNEQGVYVPNGSEDGDYSMVVHPKVVVRYADIYANRTKNFEENTSVKENILAWQALSNNVGIYEYGQDAYRVCMPYDGMHVHADNLRFAHKLGFKKYFVQGNYNTRSSGFYNLRMYVMAKLMWDTTLDANKLAEDYIKNVYGEASTYMMELYNAERDRMAYLRKNYNYGAMCLTDYVKTNYWPRPVLVRYQELINKAYDAIEYLKYVDMEKYEKTYRDIKVEEFFVTYTTLSLYRMYYSEEGKTEMIDKFEADAAKYRFTNYHESKPMSEAIASGRK